MAISRRPLFTCFLLPAFICISLFVSCKKDSIIESKEARLSTSIDSLKFDTVFTSVGSVTRSFKISNLNDQRLRLSSIKLMGGNASAFRLNINGAPTQEVAGVELQSEDSIYVFVTVHINPSTSNLPFIVRDSILIEYNGNKKYVQLEAFGQNANFLRNRVLTGNTTWTNNLPYVILGSLVIDTNAILTIDPGCKVYLHADAPFITDGTLVVNGTHNNRVIFRGDRMDGIYKDLPSSWPGIYFRESSKDNVLRYTSVLNAYQAIVVERPSKNARPKLVLEQCEIHNAFDVGLLGVNTSVTANNCLVTNCGNNVMFLYGGEYEMSHSTIAAYPIYLEHKKPVLSVTDYISQNGSTLTANLEATFTNCIFWADGNAVENETSVEKQGGGIFNVSFNSCILKGTSDPANSKVIASSRNEDPIFDSIDVANNFFDFRTFKNPAAPGINKGTTTSLLIDLDGKNRNVGIPDLGCYEKQ